MERPRKQQKLCPPSLRDSLVMSTNLPGELCGVVEQFAVLRKRPLRECQLELTRLQYTTPNHMFPPDDERPTECSDNFSEIVYYGDTEVFGFDRSEEQMSELQS